MSTRGYQPRKLPVALKHCYCVNCEQKRRDFEIKPLKDRIEELESQVGKLKQDRIKELEVKSNICRHNCTLHKRSMELETQVKKLKSNWCSTIHCEIMAENKKLKEEVEQFKCETFLYCEGCKFKKENEQLKKERAAIFEHVAKWLDSKALELRAQTSLENFMKSGGKD